MHSAIWGRYVCMGIFSVHTRVSAYRLIPDFNYFQLLGGKKPGCRIVWYCLAGSRFSCYCVWAHRVLLGMASRQSLRSRNIQGGVYYSRKRCPTLTFAFQTLGGTVYYWTISLVRKRFQGCFSFGGSFCTQSLLCKC